MSGAKGNLEGKDYLFGYSGPAPAEALFAELAWPLHVYVCMYVVWISIILNFYSSYAKDNNYIHTHPFQLIPSDDFCIRPLSSVIEI